MVISFTEFLVSSFFATVLILRSIMTSQVRADVKYGRTCVTLCISDLVRRERSGVWSGVSRRVVTPCGGTLLKVETFWSFFSHFFVRFFESRDFLNLWLVISHVSLWDSRGQ